MQGSKRQQISSKRQPTAQFSSSRNYAKLTGRIPKISSLNDILQVEFLTSAFGGLADTFTFAGRRRKKTDFSILIIVAVLIAIGIMTLYAIGPAVLKRTGGGLSRQSMFMALGVFGMMFAYKFSRLDLLVRYAPVLLAISLMLCVMILTPFGRVVYGGRRWLDIGPLSMQPSELLKASLIFFLSGISYIFAQSNPKVPRPQRQELKSQSNRYPLISTNVQSLFLILVFSVVSFFILFLQRDLGTTLVISVISLFILIKSAVSKKVIITIVTVGLIGLASSILMFGYRRERVLSFFKSDEEAAQVATRDQTPAEYHLNQSLIGIGSGGLTGKGLGKSVQSFGYLPEAPSDSIFAVYAEKFGFLGSLFLIGLFGALILKIINLSYRLDGYWSLIAIGIAGWLLGNFAVNLGSILGIIPFTGVPLPFFSLGGTNLVIILIMIGIILNLSTQARRQ